MSKPAARITDMHVCPMVTPGVPPVPHVGGPILPPGCPTVLIGGLPAARVGDMAVCVGPPDVIVVGAFTVLIGGQPAARMGDQTAHGGSIVMGFPMVLIGESGAGAGGGGAGAAAAPGASGGFLGFLAQLFAEAAKVGQALVAAFVPSAATPGVPATGLGADVDAIAAKSPTLTKNLDQLKKEGWTIKYGDAGKGTYADKTKKEIVVDSDSKGQAADVAQSLAHESGHALYQADPYVPPDGLTKQQYVDANVKSALKDEGEATLTNAQVRREILDNEGPDIGVAGAQSEKYKAVAEKYPEPEDRDKAREEIGEIFRTGETPSGEQNAGKTYGDYYSEPYANFYDENPPK